MARAPEQRHEPRPAYRLPELRQELQLHEGPGGNAARCWIIHDPVRHRYFQVSQRAFDLVARWRPEAADAFTVRMRDELDWPVERSDVDEFAKFLVANNLTLEPPGSDARAFAQQSASVRGNGLWRLLHGYLFFRIPLLNPERLLRRTLPLVSPLFTRSAAVLFAVLGIAGLYLASRQWDLFVATFIDFLSFEGLVFYAVSLVVVKALHELGHAYTAASLGVRVNAMGVAVVLMTPMLYTDVSDAWRLRDRRDKFAIDSAGVVVEFGLAAVALLLWSFLPDGALRSMAFITSTTSLFMGLMINLNPLMKFDGYYMLSDLWQVPNLQARSGALAQWWLRETLFGLGRAPPDAFPRPHRRWLIAYAICAWVYRFFLFLGIAILVYYAVFKALGVVLFAIEIIWFILLPIYREMREWWSMRTIILGMRRTLVSASVAAIALALLLVPWSSTVRIQGMAAAEAQTRLFAPRSGRIDRIAVSDRQPVIAGETLLVLSAPDLHHEIGQAQRRIALTQARLQRIAGDVTDRAERVVLEVELQRHRESMAGLEAELDRLVIRSPGAGVVRDLDRDLRPGEWIDDVTPIARVVGGGRQQVLGYVDEHDLWRIPLGAEAVFISEDPLASRRQGRVVEVAPAGARAVDHLILASVYGGAVPADRAPDGVIKPRSGQHQVRIEINGPVPERAERGMVHLSGARESIAAAIWRRLLQVLVRESSA